MPSKHLVDLTLILQHETDKAILVSDTEDSEPVWLPKSLVEVEPTKNPRVVEVTLPEHIAQEKGLI